jgi:hypothetical protein
MAEARTLSREVLIRPLVEVKNRYGPSHTYAMLSAAFVTFFLSIPGEFPGCPSPTL